MRNVSLIIPTFNRSHLIGRAVESARRASRDVEVIVVDDASTDDTARVCAALPDIKFVRLDRNQGIAAARNVGLRESTSEFVAFLDDDDVRLPGSIDAQIALLQTEPRAGMIYGRVLYGDEECRPKGNYYPEECPQGDMFWQLLRWNFIPCPSVVFRRACLLQVGLLDESAAGVDDWDLWIRIAEVYPVLATEQPVAIWRQPTPTSGQFSFRADRMHRQAQRLHRDKWLRLPRVVYASTAQRRETVRAFADYASQQLVWEAAARLKAKRLLDFARVSLAAISMHPAGVGKKILNSWLHHDHGRKLAAQERLSLD